MKAKPRPKVSRAIVAKAKQVLEFAEAQAKTARDWLELHFALFGVGGKASQLFATEAARAAFTRTSEYRRLLRLMNTLPQPKEEEIHEHVSLANGAITVRPRRKQEESV